MSGQSAAGAERFRLPRVDLEITPEPTVEECRAILAALDGAPALPPAYLSRWWASALDDLRDGALAEESGGDPGVVEP
jgi:hypothetical protein